MKKRERRQLRSEGEGHEGIKKNKTKSRKNNKEGEGKINTINKGAN